MEINTIPERLLQSFSWMLVHSVWQGLLLAVCNGILLMCTAKLQAAYRYRMICVQFFLFIISAAVTFLYEWNLTSAGYPHKAAVALLLGDSSPANVNIQFFQRFLTVFNEYSTRSAPAIVMAWALLFMWQLFKLMGNVIGLQQIRHRQVSQPEIFWIHKVEALCLKIGISRAVNLMESNYINFPVVIGHLKPLILIPAGLLSGLPQAQIEAVLLHELAHIKRNDYVVNLIQAAAEAVFFFNPGLLWISSLLRNERENCCDDVALAQTGNKKDFIQALISFKEHAAGITPAYALGFPGQKNQLLNRVSRIINNKNKPFVAVEKFALFTTFLVLLAFVSLSAITQFKPTQYKTGVLTTVKTKSLVTMAPPRKSWVHNKVEAGITSLAKRVTRENITVRKDVSTTTNVSINQNDQSLPQILNDQAEIARAQALTDRAQAEQDRLQAQSDRLQAVKDYRHAVKDAEMARMDRLKTLAQRRINSN